ncbi:hypothetical protein VBD025_15460 [Virgibacillus flavescens]|uniref:hypothetical protein n=1 Tax=Virgibacillus flavescens TaxID=1611422 RepID=UPI003D33976B
MNDLLVKAVKDRIKEGFEGPPTPVKESWFTNTEPNSGIFGALEGVTAEEASLSVHGTVLAAHVDHVRYHMWITNELLKDRKVEEMNWGESWKINVVDEPRWNQIQEELRNEYVTLLEAFDHIQWSEFLANEISGSLAHSAYHLGAIRQMLKVIKEMS